MKASPMRRPPRGGGALAPIAVWGTWAVLLAAALWTIARVGRDIPLAADWLMVAPLTGNEPRLAAWLWAQHEEHRAPLPRLLSLLLLQLTGGDFRAGMVVGALALAALAAAGIRTARALRGGRTALADIFFPLLFLHPGNWTNIEGSAQLGLVVHLVLVSALLFVIVRQRGALDGGAAVSAGLSLALLPLTGVFGIVMFGALAPWAVGTALRQQRGREVGRPRWGAVPLLAGAAAATMISALYFVGYDASSSVPGRSVGATVLTAAELLALGLGPAAHRARIVTTGLVLLVLVPTALLVAKAALEARVAERARAWGVFLFAAGMTIVALGIGWMRAAQPLELALLAVPALCAAFYVWELEGGEMTRRVAHATLAITLLLMLPFNVRDGLALRDRYASAVGALERDIRAGATPETLAARHHAFLVRGSEELLASRIRMLRDAGIGPFAHAGR